jgi:monooxygenase
MREASEVDVLIVGAGLSGIGIAARLRQALPSLSLVLLEARKDIGGTWDLFRYPGIRSDSDLFTYGFSFFPWQAEEAIAEGPAIKSYLTAMAAHFGLLPLIRFRHLVRAVNWLSARRRWRVSVRDEETGVERLWEARFLVAATGYYDYDKGYLPDFPGRERFAGPLLHPQHWPEGIEVSGKRVALIGSGATAITLAPALAAAGAHVTLVQRTPAYILPIPRRDRFALALIRLFGPRLGFRLARGKNVFRQHLIYSFCQRYPRAARALIRALTRRLLPPGFPLDPHFNPPYGPWDQRLCVTPDADFFRAIRDGRLTLVTGQIETFTETGLRLADERVVEADLVITATGFEIALFGKATLARDGRILEPAELITYRGMMLGGVPNFAFAIGYTSASWTLKVELVADYLTRLLAYMEEEGFEVAVPEPPPGLATRPLLDFGAGYVQRALARLPRQGAAAPWQMPWNYYADRHLFRHGGLEDGHLRFIPAAHSRAREAA